MIGKIASFIVGAVVGFTLGVVALHRAMTGGADPADPYEAEQELDPNVHGEFRGPDNPAPGTEAWDEMHGDEDPDD